MTNEQIGRRIRERRNEIGMSIDALAGIVGVNKSSISRYENGSRGRWFKSSHSDQKEKTANA